MCEQKATVPFETRTARNRPDERRADTPASALPAIPPTKKAERAVLITANRNKTD